MSRRNPWLYAAVVVFALLLPPSVSRYQEFLVEFTGWSKENAGFAVVCVFATIAMGVATILMFGSEKR